MIGTKQNIFLQNYFSQRFRPLIIQILVKPGTLHSTKHFATLVRHCLTSNNNNNYNNFFLNFDNLFLISNAKNRIFQYYSLNTG